MKQFIPKTTNSAKTSVRTIFFLIVFTFLFSCLFSANEVIEDIIHEHITEYNKLLKSDTLSVEKYLEIADFYAAIGRKSEVKATLKQAQINFPNNIQVQALIFENAVYSESKTGLHNCLKEFRKTFENDNLEKHVLYAYYSERMKYYNLLTSNYYGKDYYLKKLLKDNKDIVKIYNTLESCERWERPYYVYKEPYEIWAVNETGNLLDFTFNRFKLNDTEILDIINSVRSDSSDFFWGYFIYSVYKYGLNNPEMADSVAKSYIYSASVSLDDKFLFASTFYDNEKSVKHYNEFVEFLTRCDISEMNSEDIDYLSTKLPWKTYKLESKDAWSNLIEYCLANNLFNGNEPIIALYYAEKGDYKKAIEILLSINDINYNIVESGSKVRNGWGDSFEIGNQNEYLLKTLKILSANDLSLIKQVIRENDNFEKVLVHTAADFCKYSDPYDLLEILNTFEKLLPDSYYIPYFKAHYFFELETDFLQTESNLKKSLEIYPRFKYALQDLGRIYSSVHDYENAQKYLEMAYYESDPDSAYAYYEVNEKGHSRLLLEEFSSRFEYPQENLIRYYSFTSQIDEMDALVVDIKEDFDVPDLEKDRITLSHNQVIRNASVFFVRNSPNFKGNQRFLHNTLKVILFPFKLPFSYKKYYKKDIAYHGPGITPETFLRYCIKEGVDGDVADLIEKHFENKLSSNYSVFDDSDVSYLEYYIDSVIKSNKPEKAFQIVRRIIVSITKDFSLMVHNHLDQNFFDFIRIGLIDLDGCFDDETHKQMLYKVMIKYANSSYEPKYCPDKKDVLFAEAFCKIGEVNKAAKIYENYYNYIELHKENFSIADNFYLSYAKFLSEYRKDDKKALELLKEYRNIYTKKNHEINEMYKTLRKIVKQKA